MKKQALLGLMFTAFMTAASSMAAACACCGTYHVTGVAAWDALNIRSGPSVRYSKIGAIPSGSGCVRKTRVCWRRWCKVEYAGVTGWAHTGYLRYMK